jgi:threonine dehydrogenase-like Zn-dependent dehydrogenase
MADLAASLPQSYRKLVLKKLSRDFEGSTRIETVSTKDLLDEFTKGKGLLLVKNLYAGVNASDVMFSDGRCLLANLGRIAGRVCTRNLGTRSERVFIAQTNELGFYNPGRPVPYDTGLEGLGRVLAVSPDVKDYKAGDYIMVSLHHRDTQRHFLTSDSNTGSCEPRWLLWRVPHDPGPDRDESRRPRPSLLDAAYFGAHQLLRARENRRNDGA